MEANILLFMGGKWREKGRINGPIKADVCGEDDSDFENI